MWSEQGQLVVCHLWGGSPGQVWLAERCCTSLMVQEETAYPLPLGWGSGPLFVCWVTTGPGAWHMEGTQWAFAKWEEGREGLKSVPLSAQNSGPRNKTSVISEGILG